MSKKYKDYLYLNRLKYKHKFIAKAIKKYGNKYNYSKVNYINNKTDILIMCNKNHIFKQRPKEHLIRESCYLCNNKIKNYSLIQYNKYINLIYKNKYTYNLNDYKNINSIITIICPKHNKFKKKALDHLKGDECDKCNIEIIDEFLSEFNIEEINDPIIYTF